MSDALDEHGTARGAATPEAGHVPPVVVYRPQALGVPARARSTTDLRGLLDVLRRRSLVIAAGCLLGALAALVHSAFATPVYTSTSSMFLSFQGGQTPNELVQGSTYAQQLVQSYVRLATTPVVLQPVVDSLGLQESPERLASSIVIEAPVDSTSIDIRVTRSDAQEAARIARAVSQELPAAAATVTPASGEGLQVELTTVAPAQVPTSPTSPRPRLELGLGLVAGGLLGLVGAVVVEAVRSPLTGRGAVASVTDLPVLVTLPSPAERRHGRRRGRPDPLEEAHRSLREALRLGGASTVRLVLTSCRATSASTTVAVGLARATAETGRRVLLVDADLRSDPRRDDIAAALGVAGDAGLSTILEGSEYWTELVQPWGRRGFDVLVAGPRASDPGRLLAGPLLERVLSEAGRRYDVVLVRTSEVLTSADTDTLVRNADGVVLVSDTRRTSTADLAETLARLQTVDAQVPGMVLTHAAQRRSALDSELGRHQRRTRRNRV